MDAETRKQLAAYMQEKLDNYLPGRYFSEDDVLDHINDFFNILDLIKQRDRLDAEIKRLTK